MIHISGADPGFLERGGGGAPSKSHRPPKAAPGPPNNNNNRPLDPRCTPPPACQVPRTDACMLIRVSQARPMKLWTPVSSGFLFNIGRPRRRLIRYPSELSQIPSFHRSILIHADHATVAKPIRTDIWKPKREELI